MCFILLWSILWLGNAISLTFGSFGWPVRSRCISFKFDSVQAFSFDLESVYDVFYPPVVKLGCREGDEVDNLVIWVTGKNL